MQGVKVKHKLEKILYFVFFFQFTIVSLLCLRLCTLSYKMWWPTTLWGLKNWWLTPFLLQPPSPHQKKNLARTSLTNFSISTANKKNIAHDLYQTLSSTKLKYVFTHILYRLKFENETNNQIVNKSTLKGDSSPI